MIGPIRHSPDKLLLGDGGVLLGQPDGLAAEVNSATFLAAMGIGTAATFSVDYFATAVHSHDDRYYTEAEADALLSAKADLVGGKLPTSQLPALAVAEFLGVVADESEMLALDGQRGDWCNRSDQGLDYRLIDDDATLLASWRPIDGPTSAVTTVNGQAGTVVLGAADVGAAPAIHAHNFADLANLPNTLAGFGITDAATAAQGALADTAVQPLDITSGAITAGTADIDFSSGTTGFVLTQQGDGSFAMLAASGGVAGPVSSTDNAIAIWDGTGGDTLQDSPLTYTSDILLDQRNGVNGQKYRIAKTYTSATSFEAFEIDADADADNFLLTSLRGSSGGTQRGVKIGTRQDGGAFSTILTINADKTAMLGENTVLSAELRMSHSGGVGGGTLRGIQRGIEVRSQANSTDLSGGYSSATIDLSGVKVRASGFYRFVSGNDSYQDAADLCLGRDAAGQLGVYTSESKATRGSLILGSLGVWGTTPPASQPAAIADVPTGGSATAADNASAINSILAAMRSYGMIAT